jgi:hypothetical protein
MRDATLPHLRRGHDIEFKRPLSGSSVAESSDRFGSSTVVHYRRKPAKIERS